MNKKFEYSQEMLEMAEKGYLETNISAIIINGVEWEYLATGFCRRVYISPDGKTVAKVPNVAKTHLIAHFKNGGYILNNYRINHNLHEWHSYNDAPEVVKKYIAKCELLPNGILLQEYVKVISFAHRELGVKTLDDGTERLVVFDCDCFLDVYFDKPIDGYGYFQMNSPFSIIPKKFGHDLLVAYRDYQRELYR